MSQNLDKFLKIMADLDAEEDAIKFRRQKAYEELMYLEGNDEHTRFAVRLAYFNASTDRVDKSLAFWEDFMSKDENSTDEPD